MVEGIHILEAKVGLGMSDVFKFIFDQSDVRAEGVSEWDRDPCRVLAGWGEL